MAPLPARSPKLEPYTPDAFAAALKQLITSKQPKLVLMPHTYQVRDFVPKLATAMGRAVISDLFAVGATGFYDIRIGHRLVLGWVIFAAIAGFAFILTGWMIKRKVRARHDHSK